MRYNLAGLSAIVQMFSTFSGASPDPDFLRNVVAASLVHAALSRPGDEVEYPRMTNAVYRGTAAKNSVPNIDIDQASRAMLVDAFSGAGLTGLTERNALNYQDDDLRFDCGTGYYLIRARSPRGGRLIEQARNRFNSMLSKIGELPAKAPPPPPNVNQTAYQVTMQSIRETAPETTPDQFLAVRTALALYADKLKQYAGMGKDGLASAKNGVILETAADDRPLVLTAMDTYYKLSLAA